MGIIREEAQICKDIKYMLKYKDEGFRERWKNLVSERFFEGYRPLSDVCNCAYERTLSEYRGFNK